jgi:hypothetical protein
MFVVLWEVFEETGDTSYFKSLFKDKLVRKELIKAIEVINNPHKKLQDLLCCLREFDMYGIKT